jgi:NAD(P)-dependent dehydrogenase (short-subunit alcohol dehydrogenase family)
VSERRGSSVPPELSDVVDELARVLYERVEVPCDRDQIEALLASVVALAREPTGRLDLKIANAALAEMTEAFRVFRPYRDVAKVTIFGSAHPARRPSLRPGP